MSAGTIPGSRVLLLGALGVVATLLASVAWPLLVYSVSLAVFGLAHVLSELRYVDERFGARLGRRLVGRLVALLGLVVILRILRMGDVIGVQDWRMAELAVVGILAALVIPWLRRTSPPLMALGIVTVLGLAVGSLWAPVGTFLLLAVVHNLTPLGFLAEILPPGRRKVGLGLAIFCFLGLPLVIASGLPWRAVAAVGVSAPEFTVLSTGPLASHFKVYLPTFVQESSWALHAFSAAVFAQCMHYAAVIHVLPRLLAEQGGEAGRMGIVPWPRRRTFVVSMAVASVVMLVAFVADFQDGRALYGIAAAVHAWVEIPILLVAFAPPVNGT